MANWFQNRCSLHLSSILEGWWQGLPSNQAHACPFHKPQQSEIKLGSMRETDDFIEGSVFGEYLLRCWRVAWRKTVILKGIRLHLPGTDKGPSPWWGASRSCCQSHGLCRAGWYRCCRYNTQEKQNLSLISGSMNSVICWLGEGWNVWKLQEMAERQCLSTSSAHCHAY